MVAGAVKRVVGGAILIFLLNGLERVKLEHERKSPQIRYQDTQDVMPKQIKASIEAQGLQIALHTTVNRADYVLAIPTKGESRVYTYKGEGEAQGRLRVRGVAQVV